MHRDARAVLAIWHDLVPEEREGSLDWYDREHHAERIDLPGFLSARRYMAVDAAPELFNRYEVTDVGVLVSETYLACVNTPTAWSRHCQRTIVNNVRTVCRIAARAGRCEGGTVASIRFGTDHAKAGSAFGKTMVSDEFIARSGLLSAELWIADGARTTIPTEEKILRKVEDRIAALTVVIHASRMPALRQAVEAALSASPEAGRHAEVGYYALAFAMNATAPRE